MRLSETSSPYRDNTGLPGADSGPGIFTSPLSTAPAFILLISLTAFLTLLEILSLPFASALPISLMASAGWALLGTGEPNKSSLSSVVALLVIYLSGAFYISRSLDVGREFNESLGRARPPARIASTGIVAEERAWGFGRVAIVDSPEGRCVLKFDAGRGDGRQNFSRGEVVTFSGTLAPFERAKEGSSFDEYLYWRAKGASAAIQRPSAERVGVSWGVARWRAFLESRIKQTLPPRTAGYLLAAFVGDRDPSLADLHRAVGTSHLLAVSGTHVAIVYGIFWFFLRGLKFRLCIVSALVWLYVAMTGAAPSALRAAFMIQLVIMGRIIGRSGKPFNTVAAAGAIMLLQNPWLFHDVGWRLSMLAALSVTATPSGSAGARFFFASSFVWLATALQATWTFGGVPLAGLIANIFALPAFAVLFPLSFVLSLPSLLAMPLGWLVAAVPEFLFARWERLSLNILTLCPWKTSFSTPLLAFGVAAMAFFFARASGFDRGRAAIASGIMVFGILSVVFLV
ncbi:MAG: ComEC/Rec2 family competence protein [Synergistaceae bacterium]|nr:ComEC/Rec2 family competence protein [Synergistaceae bacterium]